MTSKLSYSEQYISKFSPKFSVLLIGLIYSFYCLFHHFDIMTVVVYVQMFITQLLTDFECTSILVKPPAYESEVSQRLGQPGVAVGLAWTPMGGEIMFVEASQMDGEGKVTLTGQLGDVMKESAELAMNWVRSHAKRVSV